MNLFRLLFELPKYGVTITITERNTLAVDYQKELTDEIRAAIREYKPRLFQLFSPCRHCGEKLELKVSPLWFQVRCSKEPCHLLIEEHEHSYGHSFMADYIRSVKPDVSLSPQEWMKMQDEMFERAEALEREEGLSPDAAIVRAREIIVAEFLAAAEARAAATDEKEDEQEKRPRRELVLF